MTLSRALASAAIAAAAGAAVAAGVSSAAGPRVRWADVLRQPEAWYAGEEARAIAENVLRYQRTSGGWPKDLDMTAPPDGAHADAAADDSTIDNGATTTQIRLLARVLAARSRDGVGAPDKRVVDAALRGIDFLLQAQYANGGWPQFYPLRPDYSRHITFNDNAMVSVMRLLDDAASGKVPFAFLDTARRRQAADAVARGLEVMLRTQVRVAGRLTAWCAQHDEVTLEPRKARAYEHVSLSGAESVEIVRFLMSRPGRDQRIVESVDAAVAWLRRVRISNDPPQWARFYEIGSNRPIFSGRDGIVRYDLREIEAERRDNYAWLGSWPQALIEKEYPAWKKRTGLERNGSAGGRSSRGGHGEHGAIKVIRATRVDLARTNRLPPCPRCTLSESDHVAVLRPGDPVIDHAPVDRDVAQLDVLHGLQDVRPGDAIEFAVGDAHP